MTFFVLYAFLMYDKVSVLFESIFIYLAFVYCISVFMVLCVSGICKLFHLKQKINKYVIALTQIILFVMLFTLIASISVIDKNYHIDYLSPVFGMQIVFAVIFGVVLFIKIAIFGFGDDHERINS